MLEQQLFLSKQVAELLRRGCKPRALESQLEEADFTRHKALAIFAAQQRESFAFHCHNTQPKDPAPLMPGFASRSTRRPQALSGNAQPGRVRPAPRVSAAQHSTAQHSAWRPRTPPPGRRTRSSAKQRAQGSQTRCAHTAARPRGAARAARRSRAPKAQKTEPNSTPEVTKKRGSRPPLAHTDFQRPSTKLRADAGHRTAGPVPRRQLRHGALSAHSPAQPSPPALPHAPCRCPGPAAARSPRTSRARRRRPPEAAAERWRGAAGADRRPPAAPSWQRSAGGCGTAAERGEGRGGSAAAPDGARSRPARACMADLVTRGGCGSARRFYSRKNFFKATGAPLPVLLPPRESRKLVCGGERQEDGDEQEDGWL